MSQKSRADSRRTQQRKHVLYMCGIKKFQAAEFYEGDVASREFDFQRTAVV